MNQNNAPERIGNLETLTIKNNSDTAIVLFHGYGASMRDLYGIGEALKNHVSADWFFPDGPISVPLGPMMEGRAWFPIDMAELETAMHMGEHRKFSDKSSKEFDQSQKLAIEFLKEISTKYEKLIIGGFSQGAMLASHVFCAVNTCALALFSGTLIDKPSLETKLVEANEIKFFQSHGASDPLLEYSQARDLFNLLEAKGLKGEFVSFEGGHEIPPAALEGFLKLYKNV